MTGFRSSPFTWAGVCCLSMWMLAAQLGCSNSENRSADSGESAPDTIVADTKPADAAANPQAASGPTEKQVAASEPPGPDAASPDNGAPRHTLAPDESAKSTDVDRAVQTAASPQVDTPSDSSSDFVGSGQSLDERLAAVEIPPPWLAEVQTAYDTSQPWKEARLEIRRLLSLGKPQSHREAIKLTWIYLQKDDINDGHEYPMYTFMGGEPLWSIRAHQWYLDQPHENMPIHAYVTLAMLYAEYGEFERAKQLLDQAMQNLPEPPWKIMREADLAAAYGDLYVAWGKPDEAKQHYQRAIALYPTAKPAYGGHLLPRRAAKVQSKLDLLDLRSLATAKLSNGQYRDKALGYVGDIQVTVVIADGKIADIQLKHEEKIDQNACVLIPQRIIAEQSLQVDAISGATVTHDAIIDGVFRCLKKAGLQ